MNSWSASARQPTSSSPITVSPRSRAATTTGASCGTPGLLTTVRAPGSSATPRPGARTSMPSAVELAPSRPRPASHARTSIPAACSSFATASPERLSPTTTNGPSGRGGRSRHRSLCAADAALRDGSAGRARQSIDAECAHPAARASLARRHRRPRDSTAAAPRGRHPSRERSARPPVNSRPSFSSLRRTFGRVAEGRAADRAVGLQDAVGAGELAADEAAVEGAGVPSVAAGRAGDVAVAGPVALAGCRRRSA